MRLIFIEKGGPPNSHYASLQDAGPICYNSLLQTLGLYSTLIPLIAKHKKQQQNGNFCLKIKNLQHKNSRTAQNYNQMLWVIFHVYIIGMYVVILFILQDNT